MSLIENIRERYTSRLAAGLEFIEVPEWGEDDNPLLIYFRPPGIAQQDRYLPMILQNKTEGFVELLISRALDEQGNRLFRRGQKAELMRILEPDVVSRVGDEIVERDRILSLEQAKKNSDTTPT
jgi:hypothetical protein